MKSTRFYKNKLNKGMAQLYAIDDKVIICAKQHKYCKLLIINHLAGHPAQVIDNPALTKVEESC